MEKSSFLDENKNLNWNLSVSDLGLIIGVYNRIMPNVGKEKCIDYIVPKEDFLDYLEIVSLYHELCKYYESKNKKTPLIEDIIFKKCMDRWYAQVSDLKNISIDIMLMVMYTNSIEFFFKKNKNVFISNFGFKSLYGLKDASGNFKENTKKPLYLKNIHKIKKTYIMIDENTNYYKIGCSKDCKYREKTLMAQKPTIRLICYCDRNVEKVLHKRFSRKRIRGEWFSLNESEIAYILSYFKDINSLVNN